MHGILRVLGGVAIAAVVIGVFIATEIDFGGEGTLASRVPVVSDLVDLSQAGAPGGPGPLIRAGGPMSPTCRKVYSQDQNARIDTAESIAKEWRRDGVEVRGAELAQAFAGLEVAVELFEALPRLLPREEPEASAVVASALRPAGVRVHTATAIERVEAGLLDTSDAADDLRRVDFGGPPNTEKKHIT